MDNNTEIKETVVKDVEQTTKEIQDSESVTVSIREKLLLDVKEVAGLLGIEPRTIWRYDSSGKIPAPVRFSKRVVKWIQSDLLKWIDAGCPSRREMAAV